MNLEKYTNRLKMIVQNAQELALGEDHQQVGSEHFLKALLEADDGLVRQLIHLAGGDFASILLAVDKELGKLPKITGNNQIFLANEMAKILVDTKKLARESGDNFVTVEFLFLALAQSESSLVQKIIRDSGCSTEGIKQAILKLRKGKTADTAQSEGERNVLEKYTKDLTKIAGEGKLDPVIGRDDEIRRAMQVLARRTKNNPVLIGDPGVGKTAVVEGLAQRIISKDVPECLRDKRLLTLDLGSVIAGAKFRGEFEDRIKAIMSEITEAAGGIILFIDELHTLVGAGAAEGAMDASNMLKPALSRGDLRCIGATTIDEYRKHIEKDTALARRFQPIMIMQPSVEETVSILRGLRAKYEIHHGIKISDNAIVSAATLSNRYITDRFLPDKAIDLIDESASRIRMQVDSKPEKIDKLDRKIIQLRIEEGALKREKDHASKDRLKKLNKKLGILERDSEKLTKLWEDEKGKINQARAIERKIDDHKKELEIAQREGDLARAGELIYGVIPKLKAQLKDSSVATGSGLLKEQVTSKDIAAIVAKWTGIPIEKMLLGEQEKLVDMERYISQRIVGQTNAVRAVSDAVRRARAGLQDPNRPIGSFLFLGPTGVGKTELTKALAEFLFDEESALLRIDMSEYMEKHSVARLIGSPPGYVGYEEGGALTETVRRRPYQVILFDEIEKAHSDVYNILLQVLDDGRLTDGHGHTVDFRNTLIILTSNLGSEFLTDSKFLVNAKAVNENIMKIVRDTFKPEFINRLDEMIIFDRLSENDMDKIVDLRLNQFRKILLDKNITLHVSGSARKWLSKKGYDPIYGARPLQRVIQKHLQNPIATLMLKNGIKNGEIVEVSEAGDTLLISGEALKKAS